MTEADDALTTPPWVIIGCGRLGSTLILLAERLGIEVRVAWDRDAPPVVKASHRLSGSFDALAGRLAGCAVFITVTDEAISSVAATLAPVLDEADLVVHCSGSLSSRVLRDAGVRVPVGSVHPLLSVAEPIEAVDRMGDAVWSVEGASEVVWWARGWLQLLDVEPIAIRPEHKLLYHASAVTSAGLLVGLMDAAFSLAETAGVSRRDARRMLLPLARSALTNLETMSTSEALTGPVARGDSDIVRRHLEAIEATGDESLVEVYRVLTERTERMASEEGNNREE